MKSKLTITKNSLSVLIVSSLVGCGALSDETIIDIQMYGIARAPTSATGDRDPQFQTYDVQSITLTSATENTVLLKEPTSFKIVDRPQILVSQDVEGFVDKVYTGITLVFGPTVTGGDNDESKLTFNLTQTTYTLTQDITFTKGNSKTFVVKASWENTLATGVMTEPELVFAPQ